MKPHKTIGIVGGVGPYAGIDINKKIFDQMDASTDQEYLRVVLFSSSEDIPDRTGYLLGKTSVNPAEGIFKVLRNMELMGVDVAAVACNTAHSPEIFDVLTERLKESGSRVELVHMIKEVASFMKDTYKGISTAGVLATDGTVKTDVYSKVFDEKGLRVVYPDSAVQRELVNASIYDLDYGIKAKSSPVTETAKKKLSEAIWHLINKGVDVVILGCTELPLAFSGNEKFGKPVVDPNFILARALIKRVSPVKLKVLTAV